MGGRRLWPVRAAAVAAMAGAALALPLRPVEARPDPVPPNGWFDYHDCNTGFVQDPGWYDDGPITDPFHHNVEPLLEPLFESIPPLPGGITDDPHYGVSCTIAGLTRPLLGVGL